MGIFFQWLNGLQYFINFNLKSSILYGTSPFDNNNLPWRLFLQLSILAMYSSSGIFTAMTSPLTHGISNWLRGISHALLRAWAKVFGGAREREENASCYGEEGGWSGWGEGETTSGKRICHEEIAMVQRQTHANPSRAPLGFSRKDFQSNKIIIE